MTNSTLPTAEAQTPVDQFCAKVADRIRGDIGDLMPDEMLQQIVTETIKAELERPINPKGSMTGSGPWIRHEIMKAIEPRMTAEISRQIEKQEKQIGRMVSEELAKIIPDMLAQIIMSVVKGQGFAIQDAVLSMMNNR